MFLALRTALSVKRTEKGRGMSCRISLDLSTTGADLEGGSKWESRLLVSQSLPEIAEFPFPTEHPRNGVTTVYKSVIAERRTVPGTTLLSVRRGVKTDRAHAQVYRLPYRTWLSALLLLSIIADSALGYKVHKLERTND